MQDRGGLTSQWRGPTDARLIERSIGACFDEAADRNRDREALVERRRSIRWTYGALRERVDAAALGLVAQGLSPGDRLGVISPNCAEWTALQFAAAKAGLVLVGLNPGLRAEELAYAIDKVGCAALAYAPALRPVVQDALASQSADGPRLRIEIGDAAGPGAMSFAELLDAGARADRAVLAAIAARLRPTDAAMIQFTSGTTGLPKAATLSHRNVVNSAFFGGERLAITAADRIAVPVPLFHAFGAIGGNLMAAMRGAAAILPGAGFDPGQTLAAVQEERCTALYGVPAMFAAMLAHPRLASFDLSSLRTGIIAGAPCPEALMRRVMEAMHLPDLITAFGMTETSAAGLATSRDDPIERRLRSVGRVTAHTELKVVDETGAVVPRGVAGELLTRGFAVMLGYWGDPRATAEAIDAEGWMHTGDLVAIDEEGYGTVLGRVRDVINVAGEKVLPGEVEAVLMRHPAIEAAQVFGIPDATRGEAVCAWVKVKSGGALSLEEVRTFCLPSLSAHKIPRRLDVVATFPTTPTGKVKKYAMRQSAAAGVPPTP